MEALDRAASAVTGRASPISIAVNVTPDQLTRCNLAPRILDTLQRHGLEGSRRVVEITEDAALSDAAHVHALGCRHAQGRHFGKPTPAENAAQHLEVAMAARKWTDVTAAQVTEEPGETGPAALSA